MAPPLGHPAPCAPLIEDLDLAVLRRDARGLCRSIKSALTHRVSETCAGFEPGILSPVPDGYARRLLHLDPEGRYSVLVMVWGVGQGTPIHDHDGRWCVECVHAGRIRVTSYRLDGVEEGDRHRFTEESRIHAGVGEAGALIPPFEHHTIENAGDEVAVTVHVYEGEMKRCNVYVPEPGGLWRRETRALTYTA